MIRGWRDVRLHLVHWALRAKLRTRERPGDRLVRLGSELCGWWLPAGPLTPRSVAFCVGAGEDITFDLALLERGCDVWTFDPTPRAVAYVEGLGITDDRFHFEAVGLWEDDMEVEFFDSSPKYASPTNSVVNLYGTESSTRLPVKSLAQLKRDAGVESIDICKIDIEGAEYVALESMLEDGLLPRVLLVEFDQPQPPRKTLEAVRRLEEAGYRLAKIDFFNYTFLLDG